LKNRGRAPPKTTAVQQPLRLPCILAVNSRVVFIGLLPCTRTHCGSRWDGISAPTDRKQVEFRYASGRRTASPISSPGDPSASISRLTVTRSYGVPSSAAKASARPCAWSISASKCCCTIRPRAAWSGPQFPTSSKRFGMAILAGANCSNMMVYGVNQREHQDPTTDFRQSLYSSASIANKCVLFEM
jgi:hypothetical protein